MSRDHAALRPLWICRACAQPWPCAVARLRLLGEYRDDRVGLHLYLGWALFAAAEDLYKLNPQPGPDPDALYSRFLHWARPRDRRRY